MRPTVVCPKLQSELHSAVTFGDAMTAEHIIELFRQHAGTIALEAQQPMLSNVINDLAQLLANSHEILPKETFESLVRIGGVLYREGKSQYRAKSDIDAIMKKSSRD
jgi:hypothetical protein